MSLSYKLIKNNSHLYTLIVEGDDTTALQLYKTIIKNVKNSHLDYGEKSVFFNAEHVMSLKNIILENNTKYLSYLKCIKLIHDLSEQLTNFNKLGFSLYGIDIDDILAVDNQFIFCNLKYALPIYTDKTDKMFLFNPPHIPYFGNPEIYRITILPSEINCKCIYYSLGCLVVFCLLNEYLLVNNEIKNNDEIEKIITPLYNTKIYWFIKRCLDKNVNNRRLLLI